MIRPHKHFERVGINSSKLKQYVKKLKKINQTMSVFHQMFMLVLFEYIKIAFIFIKSILQHFQQTIDFS